jgi:hypothetical protein
MAVSDNWRAYNTRAGTFLPGPFHAIGVAFEVGLGIRSIIEQYVDYRIVAPWSDR